MHHSYLVIGHHFPQHRILTRPSLQMFIDLLLDHPTHHLPVAQVQPSHLQSPLEVFQFGLGEDRKRPQVVVHPLRHAALDVGLRVGTGDGESVGMTERRKGLLRLRAAGVGVVVGGGIGLALVGP